MKKLLTLSSIALLMVGCGSSSNSGDEVTVERGPVLRAVVIDSSGQMAKEVGNGKYQFANTPKYPLTATGGFIDINRNGIVDAGDVNNSLIYYNTDGQAVTLVSTISKDQQIRDYLKSTFDLTDDEINNALPQNNDLISAISDEVYSYCIENNISDPLKLELTDIESLQNNIENRLQLYTQTQDRATLEKGLIEELNVSTLTEDEVASIQTTGQNIDRQSMKNIIDTLPVYDLTTDDKEALAHMWNEEKLAHDLYLALYDLYPIQTLYTIATNSEAEHEASVQTLLEKYNLDIVSSDFNGTYNADQLASYQLGEFILPSIQDLYNTLYDMGSKSDIDALKVGCMVEVTDVNDLDEYLNDNNITPDMAVTFNNLRSGSYHHYWAFDSALKSLGVVDGCCSLGDEYCKTPEEYPTTSASTSGTGGQKQYHGGKN